MEKVTYSSLNVQLWFLVFKLYFLTFPVNFGFYLTFLCCFTLHKKTIKDFFSKCDQIRRLHLLKISLMKNFIFCVVLVQPNKISLHKVVKKIINSKCIITVKITWKFPWIIVPTTFDVPLTEIPKPFSLVIFYRYNNYNRYNN